MTLGCMSLSAAPVGQDALRNELAANPWKSGGIYLAYPSVKDSLPPVPDGYAPVAISHYGRHGSRWAINPKIYRESLDALRTADVDGNLTAEGKTVLRLVEECDAHAKGHLGELSPLGQRQHRAIARRMAERFPSLFSGKAKVSARASEVPRCVVSMASFLNELTRMNPQTEIAMQSSPGEMEIIALDLPEEKRHLAKNRKKNPKKEHFLKHTRDSLTISMTTAARLFNDPSKVKNLPAVMRDIYDVGIAVQDVDGLKADVLSHFDTADIYNQWKSGNYNGYMEHANVAETWSAGPQSAVPILKDLIERADRSLAGDGAPVDLRFGHDTVLMRLLALLGAENAWGTTDNLEKATENYQNFRLSPMGANLQFAFFKNGAGDIIVAPRLNEQPLKINGLTEAYPGYYTWADLREHMLSAVNPVAALANRVAPGSAAKFIFREVPDGSEYFELDSKNGRVVITGNNPVNIATGLNWYLKYHTGNHLSWNNMTAALPEKLPLPKKERRDSKLADRYYLNYCTQSYSMPFWDLDRWQQEIDWMALHGINMPLAMIGTDVVWKNTLLRLGYTEEEANEFVAGPAFQAWWLMNNLEGWGGPNSKEWYKDREQLQKGIIAAMREYGMEPVLPGYSGMVPHDAAERLGVEATSTGLWNGFVRPAFLKVTDPMFDRMADIYYQELEKVSGKAKYYSMDPFHEGDVSKGVDLTEAGAIIAKAMKRANPESVWVIQGWNENPRKELLDGVKKGDIVVLDLASEIKPNWGDPDSPSLTKRADGYAPHDWMMCMILNFGGREGLHGRMDNVIGGYYKALDSKWGKDLVGYGLTPEGIVNNPVMYELAMELIWRPEKFDKIDWLKGYTKARYGAADKNVDKGWKKLAETIYNCPWGNMQQGTTESVFCARPSDNVWQVSSWSRMAPYYNPADVIAAAKDFAKGASKLGSNANYRHDLVDITRQAIAEKGRLTYQDMQKALKKNDMKAFDKSSSLFLDLIKAQDELLSTTSEFHVGPWIEAARAIAPTEGEQDQMESNARYLITTWGPRVASEEGGLRDYAHREWAGLLNDLYLKRWQTWIDAQKRGDKTPIDFFAIDEQWVKSRDQYKAGDGSKSVDTALSLIKKYL